MKASDVHQIVRESFTAYNRDLIVQSNEKNKDELPTESTLTKWMNTAAAAPIAAYSDPKAGTTTLLSKLPVPGTISSESFDKENEITTMVFSNGVKLLLKPTTFSTDQIFLNASSAGGLSLLSDADFYNGALAAQLVGASGIGDMSAEDLRKWMTGKSVMVSPYISELGEGISGGSSVKDLETALQMIYLYFTNPRKDDQVFKRFIEQAKLGYANAAQHPSTALQDTLASIFGNHHFRKMKMPVELFDKLDAGKALEIFRERFRDAGDFTFILVGSFNIDTIKPLLLQYLGGLPTAGKKEQYRDLGFRIPTGVISRRLVKGTDQKANVSLFFTGSFNYNADTAAQMRAVAAALAVKRGRIYAVGTDAEILGLKNNNTRMIDAEGRRLIPGLNDVHLHVLNENNYNYNYNIRWDGVPTLQRALEMLSEQAKRTPEGQWVKVIGGWSPYQFKENRHPTMEELNNAVPNKPLIIQYAYNRAFLNKPAMKLMGVGTSRFPLIPGTVLEKDKKGQYTGEVVGYAFVFLALENMVPQPSPEEQVNSMAYVINDLNRFGITSVNDGGSIKGYPAGHAPLQALIRDNRLNIRFPFIDLQSATDSRTMVEADIEAITKKAPISPGDNIPPAMVHGHEYEGAGELLRVSLHDYENFDEPAVIINADTMRHYIEEDVNQLVKSRIPFRMHISYNENITPFLDALEKINRQTPLDGLRWSIEHAETISLENIARVKKLGGGIALDDKMALHGDAFIKTYGREKALQTPRLRHLVTSGIPLAMTTDGFRASSYNPWVGISWTVSGKSVSGSEILAKDNRLTRAEALRLYTLGAAWFEHNEHEKGRIAPGNLADFALLNADYFTIPEDEIKKYLLRIDCGRWKSSIWNRQV